MKRAQTNFERDPRKIFCLRAKPYAMRKQEITNKVRDLINNNNKIMGLRSVSASKDVIDAFMML